MAEYIEKTKLLEQIGEDSAGREGWYGDEWTFMDTISDMPTIDIVHCSECRHAKLNRADGEYYCARHQDVFVKDYFCADGERKSE